MAKKFIFSDDLQIYRKLLQRRIYKVLIICSTYDYFMLEQDGRIDEYIFNEYVSLNLRHPPFFIQVKTAQKAFSKLEYEDIDLVIAMPSIGDMDLFDFAKQVKRRYADIPLVILTPFSRKISIRMEEEDVSAIDYIFSWLGDSNLLLAIFKLVEDKLNAENDIKRGTQAILLVEDSVRYYSSYLVMLYKLILEQTNYIGEESINEHQRMLRKRGRPKVLLARTYEEALKYYEKYKQNIIGVISDASFPLNGKRDNQAGYKLCKFIKSENLHIPLIMQSSNRENKKYADELEIGFFDKNSPDLLFKLNAFLRHYLGFGPFIFVNPSTKEPIAKVKNIKDMQYTIKSIPDDSLLYHLQRNHLSRWLRTRAVFSLGNYLRNYKIESFKDLPSIREFIAEAIKKYRQQESQGIISEFNPENYDEFVHFARVGQGMIGGKARGLAFLDLIISRYPQLQDYENINVSIPRSIVLANTIFDEFMQSNDLYPFVLEEEHTDEEILEKFMNARFPEQYLLHLKKFLSVSKKPLAVRSSSLLEDSHYQPFAGVYSTYMLPHFNSEEKNLRYLVQAIKAVYASVYFEKSKAYMEATQNVIDEEKMAVVIQELCGDEHNGKFYPVISGVARSINLYPVGEEKPEEGIVNLAFGLGKQIVEGGTTLRFSPVHPGRTLQLSDAQTALRLTQKHFYALDLQNVNFDLSVDDAVTLKRYRIKQAENDGTLDYIASTYDVSSGQLYDGKHYKGLKVITFNNILKYNAFPLAEIIRNVLRIGQKEMNNPVEIEFAVNFDFNKSKNINFRLLQIRPVAVEKENFNLNLEKINQKDTILISNLAQGNDIIKDVYDIIYVRPENFDSSNNPAIAEIIDNLNKKFLKEKKNYYLIGPGRWGSRDKWLGIPVAWSQISMARIIVEAGLSNYQVEPSQGTHFFHNLTAFHVGYFTVNPYINDGYYDYEELNKQDAVYEDDFVRWVHFDKPVLAIIDGKSRKGVIFKPGKHPFEKYEDFEIYEN